jgi:Uma2 family endonuclease
VQIHVLAEDGSPVDRFLLRVGDWTEERYFAEAPEDRLWEFEDGEIIVHSPATPDHQRVVRFLTFLLSGYVEERAMGEVFNGPAVLRLRPGSNKEPDVFFLRRDHLPRVGAAHVDGPADFVIEVVSSGTRAYDLSEKALAYRDAEVTEYWVIDRERSEILVHRAGQAEYRVGVHRTGRLESTAVPGFWIDADWLWADPLPPGPACLRRILG